MKYDVSLIFSADWGVEINADSPEEACEKAYNSDEAAPSVCHQCASHVNLGDCIRVIVYDENGDEVLDDGFEQRSISRLEKQIATITKQRDLAVEALEWACGEKPNDEGKWFDAPDGAPKYWWRTELRKALSAIKESEGM